MCSRSMLTLSVISQPKKCATSDKNCYNDSLLLLCLQVERCNGDARDIEWAFCGGDLYLLQVLSLIIKQLLLLLLTP